jgi:hypothetical protein
MTKKTIKHASADVGLIFTAYNLRRIFNLIDPNLLKQYQKHCAAILLLVALILSFYGLLFFPTANSISNNKINCSLNRLYLL